MKITTVGIDLAKNVFQVHGVNEDGKAALKKQLKRDQTSIGTSARIVGSQKLPLSLDLLSTREQSGTAPDRVVGEIGHRCQSPRVGKRPHLRAGGRAVADLQVSRVLCRRAREFLGARKRVGEMQTWPELRNCGIAEFGGAGCLDRERDVRIVSHDHWCMAAQLQ
jgi:hypothetical protein